MRFFLLLTCSLLFAASHAQGYTFVTTYTSTGSESGNSVIAHNGNAYVAGYTTSFGNGQYDALLVKTTSDGVPVWSRTYGGSSDESFRKIKVLHDGNLLMAGFTSSFANFSGSDTNIFIVTTDTAGTLLWTRTYAGPAFETAVDFEENADSSLLILAESTAPNSAQSDVFLVKLDKNGNLLWSKTIGESMSEEPASILATTNGYMICGRTNSFGLNGFFPFLMKVDLNGSFLWAKTYETSVYGVARCYGNSVIQGMGNDFILVGKNGYMSGISDSQPFLLRLDTSASLYWGKYYTLNSGDCGANSIRKTNDGNYLVSGTLGNYYPLALKINPAGGLVYYLAYGNGSGNFSIGGQLNEACEMNGSYIHAGYNGTSMSSKMLLVSSGFNGVTGSCSYPSFFGAAGNYVPTVNARTFIMAAASDSLVNTGATGYGLLSGSPDCFAVGINENVVQKELFLLPNPASDRIEITASQPIDEIYLTDLAGKQIRIVSPVIRQNTVMVDVSSVASGSYFLTVVCGKEKNVRKLIVQH